MGQGDVLLSMGEARFLHKRTKQPVLIVGRDGRPIKSDLFAGVPYLLSKPKQGAYQRLFNGPGMRPYIASKTPEKWTWKPYQPQPAELVFTPEELAFAEPYRGSVMVEPNVKAIGHANKAWLATYWQQLGCEIHARHLAPLVQCGPVGTRALLYARSAITPTFRQALAVLSVCHAFIGTEGGLHHAAAAVGTRAVVIFGGFIAPAVTGYKDHVNLFAGTGLGCGMRVNCEHCRKAMVSITPTMVLEKLKGLL